MMGKNIINIVFRVLYKFYRIVLFLVNNIECEVCLDEEYLFDKVFLYDIILKFFFLFLVRLYVL